MAATLSHLQVVLLESADFTVEEVVTNLLHLVSLLGTFCVAALLLNLLN